jgi:hypothetical protein
MTTGLSAVNLANKWLDVLSGTTFTGLSGFFVKLHTGDPGAAGANNPSAVTTRKAVTWSAASGGSKSQASAPSAWAMTTTETITHVSFWDAVTAGNFVDSAQIAVARNVSNGDSLTQNTLTLTLAPIAA